LFISREAGKNFKNLAQYNELPVYKATYDLLLAIFQFTKEFSKEYKYTFGESLKKETIELLSLIYRAKEPNCFLQPCYILASFALIELLNSLA